MNGTYTDDELRSSAKRVDLNVSRLVPPMPIIFGAAVGHFAVSAERDSGRAGCSIHRSAEDVMEKIRNTAYNLACIEDEEIAMMRVLSARTVSDGSVVLHLSAEVAICPLCGGCDNEMVGISPYDPTWPEDEADGHDVFCGHCLLVGTWSREEKGWVGLWQGGRPAEFNQHKKVKAARKEGDLRASAKAVSKAFKLKAAA